MTKNEFAATVENMNEVFGNIQAALDQLNALAGFVEAESGKKASKCYNEATCIKWLRIQRAAAHVQQAVDGVKGKVEAFNTIASY